MTMYDKSVPVPPKFDYPYQEQQRYSGSFVVREGGKDAPTISETTIREIAQAAERLIPTEKKLAPAD